MTSPVSASWRALVGDIWHRMGPPSAVLVVVMLVNGLLEGFGIALLLPLLTELGLDEGGTSSGLGQLVTDLFDVVGLRPTLLTVLVLIAGMFLFQTAVFLGQSLLAARLQNTYTHRWRVSLFHKVISARWAFLSSIRSGDVVNAVVTETSRVSGAFYLTVQIFATGMVAFVYIALAMYASVVATVLLLVSGGTVLLVTRGILRSGTVIGRKLSELSAALQGSTTELLAGAKLIKASATEERAVARITAVSDELRQVGVVSSFQPNAVRAAFELGGVLTLALMLGLGTQVLDVESGTTLVIIALVVRLYPRLSVLQQNLQLLRISLPALENVLQLEQAADAAAEPVLARRPGPAASGPAGVRIDDLTVRYDAEPVLKGVTLSVAPGQMVALVGPSGAGKSTLVDTLLGLVDPVGGRIEIDGTALVDLPLHEWRRSVGYVAQDTFLFNASVADNIRWAAPELSDEDVHVAAAKAGADAFIRQLPDGYGTVVGERGVRLSGGQRQRLGLARMLARPPRLLVLDEATSALDSETEGVVMQAIDALHGHVTIVAIAHRLATIKTADTIHVLQDGELVESGSWADLVDGSGRFSELWRLQDLGSGPT